MGLFWKRKNKDQFVSLGLNQPREAEPTAKITEDRPAVVEKPVEVASPTVTPASIPETRKPEPPAPVRSPFQTSVLGLNLSMEELQAQEAALEQEFSARFRRAVAATRESLSDRLDK